MRQVREERGLTRNDLARKLGLSDSTQISRYENSKAFPPVPAIQKLALILDVDLHWLITGVHSPSVKVLSAAAEKYLRELGERIKQLEDKDLSFDLAARFRGEENKEAAAQNERSLSHLKAEYTAIVSVLKRG
ncbi:MAG: helix-turn-helix domain-containing protein [Phycisphaerae bacterium]|nr:helix-turn-helix domain-containing protein [Phycisphaerae bacterium]